MACFARCVAPAEGESVCSHTWLFSANLIKRKFACSNPSEFLEHTSTSGCSHGCGFARQVVSFSFILDPLFRIYPSLTVLVPRALSSLNKRGPRALSSLNKRGPRALSSLNKRGTLLDSLASIRDLYLFYFPVTTESIWELRDGRSEQYIFQKSKVRENSIRSSISGVESRISYGKGQKMHESTNS